MKVTPVAVADGPLRNSTGVHEPYALRAVVELVGEDGLSGFGEIACGADTCANIESVRDLVVGRSVFDLNEIERAIIGRFGGREADPIDGVLQPLDVTPIRQSTVAPRTFSPIEVAALDLAGKALSRPVYDLLGGKVRDRVGFSAYLFYKYAGGGGEHGDERPDKYGEAMTPEALIEQAKAMVAEYGFKSIKLKAGVLEPDEEIRTMFLLRDAFGPDVPLRIDPNCAWTVETSVRVGKELAGVLEYLEDPTPTIPGMAEVRARLLAEGIETPLATNMCVTKWTDIPEAVACDAVQVILGDHHYWGGLRAVTQLGRLCETFGIGLSMHSNTHLGISLLAMAHLAAATPHLTYDSDTHYPWLDPADDVIEQGAFALEDGAIQVPDRPGLGFEIDRDALARGHERYQKVPYRDRDDVAEMRKRYDPTWERKIPRW